MRVYLSQRSRRKEGGAGQAWRADPGRSAGLLVVASSYVGSHFGGGMTVGGAELGARSGLSGIWYGLACSFGVLGLAALLSADPDMPARLTSRIGELEEHTRLELGVGRARHLADANPIVEHRDAFLFFS